MDAVAEHVLATGGPRPMVDADVEMPVHKDAFYPSSSATRQRRSSSMEDLESAEPVVAGADHDDTRSIGEMSRQSILSKGSARLSEAADAAFKQLSADSDVSLLLQALFQWCLISTATVSVFVWMFRAAFGSRSALDRMQFVADVLFAAIYTFGYVQKQRQAKARAMAKKMSMLDDVVHLAKNRYSPGALGHPTNMVLHVCFGAILPVIGDFIVWALFVSPHENGLLERQDIHQMVVLPGCFRLFHLLGFGSIFKELDINLAVPHYPVFIVRNLLILCANTHAAACFFWVMAESSDFNEKTWVSSTSPGLVNATMGEQYVQSLYLATFVVLVPTAFSPTSQVEILYTIFFVMLNIFIVANIIGGLSALQGMADQELAIHRRVCDEFEKMFQQHLISEDVVQATRQFLRMDAHQAHADINQLPMAVRARIREQRFADTVISHPLFKGLSRRFVDSCIACVHEDTYVAGLDIIRQGDVPKKCSIILDGFASIMVVDPEMDDEDGFAQSVATLVPGASFGQEGFVTGTASPWTIQAKTIVRAISFSETDRDALDQRFPHDFHKLRTNLLHNTTELETSATRLAQRMIEKAELELRQANTQAEHDRHAARSLFEEFDEDGNGSLEMGEIRALVNRLGLPLSSTQVKDALGYMDNDGNGTVNKKEFLDWYDTARHAKSRDGVQSVMVDKMKTMQAQKTWENMKNTFKTSTIVKALQPPNAKSKLHGFVHGLSQRTKLHSLRIWVELPDTMTPTLVQELAKSCGAARVEIARDRSRASHDLAGLICHLANTGDAPELDRMLSLVPATEIPSDYDGRAGLHLAAAGGHTDAVSCLLSHKANVNVIDRFGRTPIAEAVLNNKKQVLQLLRSHGADLQLSEQDTAGVLCEAANVGDNQTIQLYIDAGADPNSADVRAIS
jgi:CRP-like cAMP-binding protein